MGKEKKYINIVSVIKNEKKSKEKSSQGMIEWII